MVRKVRQAVILVGGKGTRLRPLTDSCPKPILPVLDRPCLDYLIESLAKGGIEHIILACGYRSEQIPEAIGDGSGRGIRIEYSYEDVPMGTAGAIKLLENKLDDVFVAVNGDVFADIDVKGQIREHQETGACVTISLTPVDDPCEFGIVRTDDTGRITEFKEKPAPEEVFSNLINAGVYVVNKDVLKYVPDGRMYDFSKELVPGLMDGGHVIQGHLIDGVWIDVGRPSDLIRANLVMAEKEFGNTDWGAKFSGTSIEGIFYAGSGCEILSSRIRNSTVSRGSEIKGSGLSDSLVFKNCSVENSNVTNSIIGKGCTIISSTILNRVIGDGSIIENDHEE